VGKIMRRSFISMTWTPGVELEDAQTMVRTVEDVYGILRRSFGEPGQFDPLPIVRVFGSWTIPACPPHAVYGSMDWFVTHSLDDTGKRISAARFLENVRLEPWQANNPHLDLCMTEHVVVDDRGSTASPLEVMGVSQRALASLISLSPLDSIANPDLRKLAIRHVVAHFLGLLFDVPIVNRTEHVVERDGDLFCLHECAMRYTDSSSAALAFAQQQAASNQIFCDACQRDLLAQVVGFHYGLN
jgi:hypothetical protein